MAEEIYLEHLNYLHPKIRPYVKVVLTHEFGLLRDLPTIQSIQSGCIVRKNRNAYGDRFHLKINYCRKPLVWQVIMNGDDVTRAPDFIMEENFLEDITPETIKTKVPSLFNWCPTNVKCLLNVILELLQLYKDYQVNLLSLSPSLHRYLFEYDTLLSMTEISKNEIEVYVQTRPVVVLFLIRLNVDFSILPTALPDTKDLTVLAVEFKDNAKSTIQLLPRIEVRDALAKGLELPDLPTDMSLMDYVPEVEQLLRKKIDDVIRHTQERKMLYSYLVQFFEPSLINGDNINFENVSFLLERDNFYCVLTVKIPLDYPDSRPILQFLSLIKSSSHRAPEYNSFPYNGNMTHEDVARVIFRYVRDQAIGEYKKSIS